MVLLILSHLERRKERLRYEEKGPKYLKNQEIDMDPRKAYSHRGQPFT